MFRIRRCREVACLSIDFPGIDFLEDVTDFQLSPARGIDATHCDTPPDNHRVNQGVVGGWHRADGERKFRLLYELTVPASGMRVEYLILIENRDEIQPALVIQPR